MRQVNFDLAFAVLSYSFLLLFHLISSDDHIDQNIIKILMGDEVSPRKDFIINRALEVSNLDI